MTRNSLHASGAAAALMMASWAGAAGAPTLAALKSLEPGEWVLRQRGEGAELQRLCVADPAQLLQIRHRGIGCKRFTVSDSATVAVVTYDCAGAGSGRTDLRVETPRLVQLHSQGIEGGAPFDLDIEARRLGECRSLR